MPTRFEITRHTPLVIDAEGCIKMWDAAHNEYFRCSKEFWNDVNDMIQNPDKWQCVIQEPTPK